MLFFFWFDYNLDEYPDLFLFGNYGSTSVIRLYKNVEGVFSLSDASVFSNSLDIKWPARIQMVDFNIDGYPDIVIGGDAPAISTSKLSFYENHHGTFKIYSGHGISTLQNQNFCWADYDNDGDPDMLHMGIQDYPKTQIYVNNTIDNKGPVIHLLIPRNKGALRFENGYELKIEFHEPIFKGNGVLHIYRQNDNQLIDQVNVSESTMMINDNVVTVNLQDTPFNNSDKIYILLDPGIFKDIHNNPSIGISDKSSWTLTINTQAKLNQTISFAILPEAHVNDSSIALVATASSNLPVSFTSSNPSVATIQGNLIDILRAGTAVITASQAGNDIYNAASSVKRSLIVSKLDQHIIFEPLASKLISDSPFDLIASASSGLGVTYTSSDQLVATISGNTATIRGPGSTVFTATQTGSDSYYAAIPVQQTLTISKLTQHITFEPLAVRSIRDEPFELRAHASSGLPVLYSLSNSGVATLAGNTLTIVGVGEVQITASQEGDNRFEAAPQVLQVLVVNMITAIERLDDAKVFSIFPNPASDEMKLILNDVNIKGPIQIHFLDSYGRFVKQVHLKDKRESILNLNDLHTGVYILQILCNDNVVWKRIVKI